MTAVPVETSRIDFIKFAVGEKVIEPKTHRT